MPLPTTDDDVLLLHNSRCSKSRATHALLGSRGVAFRERVYLEQPLDRAELADLRDRLGRPVREWVRAGEAAFAEAGLSKEMDEERLLDALVTHPILMERPIVVRGGRAMVGRPPEAVLALFESEESPAGGAS